MKVDRTTLETHRTRLLAAGARLFRVHGVDRVSLADISAEAGLTHGAFYGHYTSKSVLAETACKAAARDAVLAWRDRAARARQQQRDPLDAIIDEYLTLEHCQNTGRGCVLAAMAVDAGRPDHDAVTRILVGLADDLAGILALELAERHAGQDQSALLRSARGALAAMQGGLILARAKLRVCDDTDEVMAILAAARQAARRALD